eukprot:1651074-Pleurochrysis_carterae.AAC.1
MRSRGCLPSLDFRVAQGSVHMRAGSALVGPLTSPSSVLRSSRFAGRIRLSRPASVPSSCLKAALLLSARALPCAGSVWLLLARAGANSCNPRIAHEAVLPHFRTV